MGCSRLVEREGLRHMWRELACIHQPGKLDKAIAVGQHGHALDVDTARAGLRPGGIVNVEQRNQNAATQDCQRLVGMVAADRIQYQIDIADFPREIILGVVDHLVGAERADEIRFARAGRGNDIGAARLGDLHRQMADATCTGMDQRALARLQVPWRMRPCQSVKPASGKAAACAWSMAAGFAAISSAGAAASSA